MLTPDTKCKYDRGCLANGWLAHSIWSNARGRPHLDNDIAQGADGSNDACQTAVDDASPGRPPIWNVHELHHIARASV